MKKIWPAVWLFLFFLLTTGSFLQAGEPLTCKDIDNCTLALFEGEQPIWKYVYRQKIHDWVSESDKRRLAGCYLHPLYGFDGEALTVNATTHDNHQHHHGIWHSFMTVILHRPNGKNETYDTWTDDGAMKRQFISWGPRSKTDGNFTFTANNGWFINGQEKVMNETLTIKTHQTVNDLQLGRIRALDYTMTLEPVGQSVTLAGDRKNSKNFSSLTARFIPPVGKSLVRSAKGEIKSDELKIVLPWIDYQANFGPKAKTAGVAFFPHPNNPKHETGWAIRHYGMIVAGWPGCEGTTLMPEHPVTLSWRILLHEKNLSIEQLAELFDQYTKESVKR